MLSKIDVESLIAEKRREIEKEKTLLGLSTFPGTLVDEKEASPCINSKRVYFPKDISACGANEVNTDGNREEKRLEDLDESIPADLERYIRRYLGLPVMLKAGEYSPNNPLLRGERMTGDVLVGLGEYERRRNTLRKIRQQQYKEYLDQQAKKKQEAKEEAERERREREEREREKEERERRRAEEELERSPERRRAASLSYVPTPVSAYTSKKDTGVQVDGITRPLSVAVQTDEAELFRLCSLNNCELTEAERELSPRTVDECSKGTQIVLKQTEQWKENQCARRRSYGDYDERTCSILNKTNRDKLVSDLRHTYMPSIFDADAIQLRNVQSEKEAAERRQFYQQELKNQIMEQQRIKEERKTREKMLELAEMRRLEEQLKMLKVAQEKEITRQSDITTAIKDHAEQYDSKRKELQKEIEMENRKLRNKSQYIHTTTSKSDTATGNLQFYYPKITDSYNKTPFSLNMPESSIFSSNYDVDSYLRRNLNFKGKMGKSTSVDDFRIATDSVRSLQKPLVHEIPNFYNKHSNNFESNNRLEKETLKNMSSPQNRNNNNFEYIDKDNEISNTEVKLGVKDKSPIGKGNKVQYNFDNNNDYNHDIDDIITGNDKYVFSKDITTHDKDSDVVVKRRNKNFQIARDDDKSDNLDVQVRERTDKYTISKDKNDMHPISNKNEKYQTTNCKIQKRTTREENDYSEKSNKFTISRDKNSKYPIITDNIKKYENDKYILSDRTNGKYINSSDNSQRNKEDQCILSNNTDKYTISSDNNDRVIRDKDEKYTLSEGNSDKYPLYKDKNRKYTESNEKMDKNIITDILPIPVLRHSPKIQINEEKITNMSDAMKVVEDKWKVPAVQKNILKNVNDDGKSVSILTQLGSIRRQLQLEQLKLDKMLTKDDV